MTTDLDQDKTQVNGAWLADHLKYFLRTLARTHQTPSKRCATPCRRHSGLGSTLCINIKNNSCSGRFIGLKRQNVPEKYQNMLFAVKELAQNLQPLQKRVQA